MSLPTAPALGTAPSPPAWTWAVRPGRVRRVAGRIGIYLLAGLMALWVLVPIYLITVLAFSSHDVIYGYPKQPLPQTLSSDTMAYFIGSTGVVSSFINSILVAAATAGLTTALGVPAGYVLARYVFRGRHLYELALLSTQMFPVVVLAVPLAVLFLGWGLYDSIWSVALMHTTLSLPFTVLITASVFGAVPRELEEAAETLGTSRLGAVWRIVWPLALPGIVAAAIFAVVVSWNEVFAASILTLQNRTLPAQVLAGLESSTLPYRLAGAWFMLAPSFVFMFLIRRRLLGLWAQPI